MSGIVQVDMQNAVGIITMNRPDKRNALSRQMVTELIQAFDLLDGNDQVKVILLKGEGKSFCAGGDLDTMQNINHSYDAVKWVDHVANLTQKILDLDKYVVAMVHGYGAGAGFSLALACDFVVMEDQAKFVLSFNHVGLIPDLGLIRLLYERIPPVIFKEWISSGKIIDAQEALRYGLINRVAKTNITDETMDFIQFMINGPTIANKYVKYLANHMSDLPLHASFRKENMIQSILLQTEDHKEGARAFKEKRDPIFKGR